MGALLPETAGINAAFDQYWACTFCLNLSITATSKKGQMGKILLLTKFFLNQSAVYNTFIYIFH